MTSTIDNKLLYQIGLTQITGVGVAITRSLMKIVGDEEQIFKEKTQNLLKIPGVTLRLVNEIKSADVLRKADEELDFVLKNNLEVLFFNSSKYPSRLNQCIDAPILLYVKGDSNLNYKRIISIVGTRNATAQGYETCSKFIKELSEKLSDVLIVSGLAYGIDIFAHRASLENNIPTVAVLAHGLDRIYPAVHRKTAIDMIENGALITEFPSKTTPERFNFVKRNRIVAGLSDVLLVVESADRGGSLITADIANSYYKEVFAMPGRNSDTFSTGCNKLIATNRANMFLNTDYFIEHMGWDVKKKKQPTQKELFVNLSEDEERVFNILNNVESIHVNQLGLELDMPVSELFLLLLEMEMKNLTKPLPGGMYKLL